VTGSPDRQLFHVLYYKILSNANTESIIASIFKSIIVTRIVSRNKEATKKESRYRGRKSSDKLSIFFLFRPSQILNAMFIVRSKFVEFIFQLSRKQFNICRTDIINRSFYRYSTCSLDYIKANINL